MMILQELDIRNHTLGYATRTTPKKGGYTTLAPTRPLLTNGGGGGRGVPLGLPQDQAAHPPTQADPPTQTPPYPPGLCCYNQLVTQKPCVFAQNKFCPSVTVRSLKGNIAELAGTRVVDHCTGKLQKRWFNPHCLWTGNFCHFLTPFSIKVADPPTHPPRPYPPPPPLGGSRHFGPNCPKPK